MLFNNKEPTVFRQTQLHCIFKTT